MSEHPSDPSRPTSTLPPDLDAAVTDWIARDPDPRTRAELAELRDAGDVAALRDRFGERLEFGTAGIRGELGAGPSRMNRVVVRETTAGVALRLSREPGAAGGVVVVGHDARHGSAEFAADAAAVLLQAGFAATVFPTVVPTPLVAWATRELGAVAGIQITASHNPPQDNGYKVYWRGGAQIVAPLDAEIAACVTEADPVGDLGDAPEPPPVDPDVTVAYHRAVAGLLHGGGRRDLTIVFTPLHGVAGETVQELLDAAGFTDVYPVAEQFAPDPAFSTVSFPNPEMPGALDRAVRLAEDVGADLVIANDPDGDRIAVAIPDRGNLRVLSGDELGCLLAEMLLTEGLGPGASAGGGTRGDGTDGDGADGAADGPWLVATTAVSSQLLRRIADAHGAAFAETLTGFKWLARAAAEHAQRGIRPLVAYEQALGVMIADVVADKDGMSAALVVADLAARLADRGRTLLDVVDDLARQHGVHLTTGRSLTLTEHEPGTARAIVDRLRSEPPSTVADVEVVRVDDYLDGVRTGADGSTEPIDLPEHPLVSLVLADGSRLQARPSGTEPLLKFYIEVVEPVAPEGGDDVEAVRARAAVRLEALADAFQELATPA